MRTGEPISTAGAYPDGLMFFNAAEARTLDALTSRIMPSEPDGLGAREAAVITYIDHAVAGYFHDLQGIYRAGLQRLDAYCLAAYGLPFAALGSAEQDEILRIIDGIGNIAEPPARAAEIADGHEGMLPQFFAIVLEHTIQGMFRDPIYGGNRDFTGWRLIGFPGAQWGYTAEQMREGFDATTIPILSLADLQRGHAGEDHD